MEPKVSVVIPNYNGIEFNRTCLLAMRRQTRPADKIIVVDNGSSEENQEKILADARDYATKQVRLWYLFDGIAKAEKIESTDDNRAKKVFEFILANAK